MAEWLHGNTNEVNRQRELALATLIVNGPSAVEIEQEKLHTVEIPNPHHDGITVLEKVGDDVIIIQMDYYLTDWRKGPEHQLTESEIRKGFEWAWNAGFAKEVE